MRTRAHSFGLSVSKTFKRRRVGLSLCFAGFAKRHSGQQQLRLSQRFPEVGPPGRVRGRQRVSGLAVRTQPELYQHAGRLPVRVFQRTGVRAGRTRLRWLAVAVAGTYRSTDFFTKLRKTSVPGD